MKERIIGAVALVAIAVLVVPVFLDGPATDTDLVSESVALPGQDEQMRKRETIVLERDRDQPVPATSRRSAQATTAEEKLAADAALRQASNAQAPQQQAATTSRPAEEAPPPRTQATDNAPATAAPPSEAAPTPSPGASSAPSTQATAESSTGMWAVQLGSFSNQANAERLAAELRSSGYAAFLSRLQTDSGSLHRVRVGPQKDRASAEGVAGRLGADGHKGQVVPHP